jgi:hypothetical protein
MRAEWERFMSTLPPAERGTNAAALAAAREAAISQWRFFGDGDRTTTVWRMMLRPSLGLGVIRAWRDFPRLAAAFGRRHSPEVRFVIAGHCHRAGVRSVGDITVVNTGAYAFPGRPHAAIVEGNRLSLWPIERQGRGIAAIYRLSPRGPRWSQDIEPPGMPARSSREGKGRASARSASAAASSSAARSTPVAKPDPEAA